MSVVELPLGRLRDLADRLVQRQVGIIARGAGVDLVVDVGDVADIGDVLGAIDVAEQAEQHVEHDDRAGVADMGEVVDRRPAHVHAHVVGIDRHELGLLPRQRVVELERQTRPLASFCLYVCGSGRTGFRRRKYAIGGRAGKGVAVAP